MTARCERTDLLATDCAHCRNLPDPPKAAGERGPWFEARYAGRCNRCGCHFLAGFQVRADGHGGYLGPCCGEDDDG